MYGAGETERGKEALENGRESSNPAVSIFGGSCPEPGAPNEAQPFTHPCVQAHSGPEPLRPIRP